MTIVQMNMKHSLHITCSALNQDGTRDTEVVDRVLCTYVLCWHFI